jgi:predicted ATP-grasp superfamily ATP-dependent carboligase
MSFMAMRIFVFEYITGGGMISSELPASLAREGDLMLQSLVSDLCDLDAVEVVTTRDARLAMPGPPVECHAVRTPEQFPAVWHACLEDAQAVWPIAPERQQMLERISATVCNAGRVLLNSPPRAVRTTASKLTTARLLAARGVDVVPTFGRGETLPDIAGRWVLKPDDGVGCLGVKVFPDRDALGRQWESLPDAANQVAQPFVEGMAASLCMLAKNGEAAVLSVNRQRIAVMDDTLVLLGCVVSGAGQLDESHRRLARKIAAALPDLWGFVGVDFIATPRGPQVLEVNPRLTTSYAGLRESLGINPAGLVLDLAAGGRVGPGCPLGDARAVDVCVEYASVA